MITLLHVHYEIHDEVRKNDKVHNSFIKAIFKFVLNSKIIFCIANFFYNITIQIPPLNYSINYQEGVIQKRRVSPTKLSVHLVWHYDDN